MTYTIIQTVRGRPYAYEVQAYWDPLKKQSRQRRKYLGAIDEKTGKVIPKTTQRAITLTKIYGTPYILNSFAADVGLRKNLHDAFGDDGDKILSLVLAKIIGKTALKNIHHIMDDAYIAELYGIDDTFTSQRVSDFLSNLAKRETEIVSFFTYFIEEEKRALVYDVTALSSYSKKLDWLEYGSDYRWTRLPQINIGLVLSLERHIPVYYKLFPGSITDVTTLKNLIAEVKAFGIGSCLFILDRGFYSEGNIIELKTNHIEFIMPVPFNVAIAKSLVSETNKSLHDPRNAHMFKDELYYVEQRNVTIGGFPVQAFIIFNNRRQADERRTLFAKIEEVEAALNGAEVKGDAQEMFETVAGDYAHMFKMTVKGNNMYVERRSNAISFAVNRCGKVVLLSSRNRSWDDALSLYRERDAIEKEFNDLKNELEALPLRVSTMQSLKGLMFVFFNTLVLRSVLLTRAKAAKLLSRLSIDDILFEMGKLRAVNIGGEWRLSEVSKKQKILFEKLGVAIPRSVGNLVTNGAGV